MKYLSVFALVMLLASCDPRAKLSINNPNTEYVFQESKDNFFPELRVANVSDTVYLDAEIDDCGEWGGPKDRFVLYKDSLGSYKLNCVRHRFNCDSIGFYYSKPKSLEYCKTIVLEPAGKQAVTDFFKNLMVARVGEKYTDWGNHFYLHNNDSTLVIKVKSDELDLENKFYHFKKQLGLPENRNKEHVSIPIE